MPVAQPRPRTPPGGDRRPRFPVDRCEGAHYYSNTVAGAEKLSLAPFRFPMKKTVNLVGLAPAGASESRIARPAATILPPLRATQKMVRRRWATLDWLTIVPLAKTPSESESSVTLEIAKRGTCAGTLPLAAPTFAWTLAGVRVLAQIQPQIPAQSIDTEVFALDKTTKQVVPTDSFSCSGIIPGYGINCVGTYGGNYEIVAGQFSIDPKLCDEPRVDPLLTVVYATRSGTSVTQAIAGPFDLGRPHGCPKSAQNGKWRIPQDKEESPL